MKKNTLTTAILAGLTGMAGMVSVSNATGVHVNPEGTGQVLIYPFYTTRGGNDTLISIVNTNERGKAVKVRFREALNSREVLDFHLYLSPFDVWTGALTATDTDGARLHTADTSCTVPAIPSAGQELLVFDFAQTASNGFTGTIDGAGTQDERTASGYIEVIEMGTMVSRFVDDAELTAPTFGNFQEGHIEWAAKHGPNGVPNSCATLIDAWSDYTGIAPANRPAGAEIWLDNPGFGLVPASGGLFGSASIINVSQGTMFSYNAVALENFWGANDGPEDHHSIPGFDAPNLASTGNTTSHVLSGGSMVDQTFDSGIEAVSAALTQSRIFNEYVTDESIGAQTEWVVTFPTKSYHVDPFQFEPGFGDSRGGLVTGSAAVAPFTSLWNYDGTELSAACESLNVFFWDREEQAYSADASDGNGDAPPTPRPPVFSPRPFDPDAGGSGSTGDDADPNRIPTGFSLCSEANVIQFSSADGVVEEGDISGILAEPARAGGLGLVNFALGFDSGWAEIDLVSNGTGERNSAVADSGGSTQRQIQGLPVVGFAVTTYTNNELRENVIANYGGTFNHRGSRSIVVSS